MDLRSGIELIRELEGSGPPIENLDTFDACLKFYRNQGDPLIVGACSERKIPAVLETDDGLKVEWQSREPPGTPGHVVFVSDALLAREADLLPGIYYAILGMKTNGYRHVSIPPHLFAHSMFETLSIPKESLVKVEIFLTSITSGN